jgi:hypothetical protein
MKPFVTIVDWRSQYFGLPTQPPRRHPPSDEMTAWREENERREQRERAMARKWQEYVAHLREQEEVERWAPLVEQFGAEVVETLQRRWEPAFRLPAALRPIEPEE